MRDVFICDAVRTPIGRFGGALAKVRADDLAAVPIKALMAKHPGLDWSDVDEVFYGCANQAGEDNRNVARMAVLLAGLPESVPAQTLNRLCASGLDAVGAAGRAIRAGEIDFAGTDRAARRTNRIEPRRAQTIERLRGNRLGQTCEQDRHARHVAVVLAGLVRAAAKNFVDR